MKLGWIIGAAAAAVLGAAIWATVSAVTGYEVGYVAWGIGVLVGVGARMLGGKGPATGVACAIFALASIFVGKMLAVQYSAPGEIRAALEEEGSEEDSRALYDEIVTDATDFAQLTSEDEYPAFMVSHGYTEAENPEDITEEELANFKEYSVESLRRFSEEQPTYEQWREETIETTIDMVMAELPITELVVDDLGLFDVIFAVLGLVTAYKIACGQGEDESA